MSVPLETLPNVPNFLGFIDLKSGSYIIAALGIVHIIFFGCTYFMPLSYQLVTIWILVAVFSGFSCMLLYGVYLKDDFLMSVWIWYSLVFVAIMLIMMLCFICVFCSRKEYCRLQYVLLGIMWYILTIYFIFVVNSYRMETPPDASGENNSVNDEVNDSNDEDKNEPPKNNDSGDSEGGRKRAVQFSLTNVPGPDGDNNQNIEPTRTSSLPPTRTSASLPPTHAKLCLQNPDICKSQSELNVNAYSIISDFDSELQ